MQPGKFRHHSTVFVPRDNQPQPKPLTPVQVAKAYNFPPGVNLQERCVAVIELGGGYSDLDISLYCDKIGVKHPTLHWRGVGGASNDYIPSSPDMEVQLDLCVLAGAAPGLTIWTIFAPNTSQGFASAILEAADNLPVRPDAISISWGAPEDEWAAEDRAAMDKAFLAATQKGIAVYAAAGDNGSSDGVSDGQNHVDYPASSPFVTGCGGTRLDLDASGKRAFEKVWSLSDGNGSTGGGISKYYAPLADHADAPGRQVPDVAGNADPVSGYQVKVDFLDQVIGGTSAVAPLMAALHAVLQSYFAVPLGDIKDAISTLAPADVFDVIEGSNGAFKAGVGSDFCTGKGVPDGTGLLNHLISLRPGAAATPPAPPALSKVEAAVHAALAGHKHAFGHYGLTVQQILQIVEIVLKVLATLTSAECAKCFSEVAGDFQGG